MNRLVRPLSLAPVLLSLVCPLLAHAQTIAIARPMAGSELTCMPLDLAVDLDATADTPTFSASLNGSDVSSAFILDPPAAGRILAHAEDVWGAFVLCDDDNTLDVSVELGGIPATDQVVFATSGDPYADIVDTLTLGGGAGFGTPELMLGAPVGSGPFVGSLDVVSLGTGGSVILEFSDNVIVDGPGVDFTVFENTFLLQSGGTTGIPFSEPGRVSVSQDKQTWHVFACAFESSGNGPYWTGCAGVYPTLSTPIFPTPHPSIPTDFPIEDLVGVPTDPFPLPPGAGGDSFDLAGSSLGWARYVRIEAAAFNTGLPGGNSDAFDVEAVAAVNAAPSPPVAVPALSPLGLAVLVAAFGVLGARRRAGP